MKEQIDHLLTNTTILTSNEDSDIFTNTSIAIKENKILEIGETQEVAKKYESTNITELSNKVIIPGLVNSHTHIPMSLFRGLYNDLGLKEWLENIRRLEQKFITPDFVRLGVQLACAEMIRSGTTCFADIYFFENEIAEEVSRIGMRGLFGQTVMKEETPDSKDSDEGLTRANELIKKWQGHNLIQPAIAPHAWYTTTPEILQKCSEIAVTHDVPLHIHVSETKDEVEGCIKDNNVSVVDWLKINKVLETKLLAAHCVHLSKEEIIKLKEANAGISHCPSSNMKLASGIAPTNQMLETGINLGIGTDGPASNNDMDMFEEMRLASFLAKVSNDDPAVLPAKQTLELATISGARALHMSEIIGSLEVGKKADLAIIDFDSVHNLPNFSNDETLYSKLVYSTKSADILHVMCDGKWLMKDRVLLTIDEEGLIHRVKDMSKAINSYINSF